MLSGQRKENTIPGPTSGADCVQCQGQVNRASVVSHADFLRLHRVRSGEFRGQGKALLGSSAATTQRILRILPVVKS